MSGLGYWLADARRGQEERFIKRFASTHWTVNFPRPMMASVVTTAADALRVDAVFYGSGDLAGLIWEAEDKWSHPLLAYEKSQDFRDCVLRFRWRSGGLKQLDEVHGPTLTMRVATQRAIRGPGMCGFGTMRADRRKMLTSF